MEELSIDKEDLKYLAEFNRLFAQQATIYNRSYIFDADGYFRVDFYLMTSGLCPYTGKCRLKYLGCYIYSNLDSDHPGYHLAEGRRSFDGYPMSHHSVTRDEFDFGYKKTHVYTENYRSEIYFYRFWEWDIEKIEEEYPLEAKKIVSILDEQILDLEEVRVLKDYKSSWVYYQFCKKVDSLSLTINGSILRKTRYLYHPSIYYNRYSNRIVSRSEKEKIRPSFQNKNPKSL